MIVLFWFFRTISELQGELTKAATKAEFSVSQLAASSSDLQKSLEDKTK